MKKRAICLLLALVMALGLCPVSMAAAPSAGLDNFKKVNTYTPGQFSDVSDKAWYAANVKASIELGLVTGRDSGFAPDANMQIVEAIALAAKIHSIYHTGSAKFVQGSPWYQVYVDYAVDNGIIAAGEYANLSVPATRGQFFNIFAKSVPESALQPINDVAVGSIHDLPAASEYAEAAYLLYNAGILTGSDAYGTFNAEKQITRIEAATLATRVADPTLRKTVELKVYDPYPPTGITIRELQGGWSYEEAALYVGDWRQLDPILTPANARSGMTWATSDPAVATVDQWGKVTAQGQGSALITATAYNGVSDSIMVTVAPQPDWLEYALTQDGTGYEIVRCDPEARVVTIPAEYQGLPVVAVRGGAFMDCVQLHRFIVDPAQTTFYQEDGVLFTDSPEKTLVCYPAGYDRGNSYFVPEGTVAIAPYAFAGIQENATTIILPEGVVRLGDYAFAKMGRNVGNLAVYVPDSLTEIGVGLFQDQGSNGVIYFNSADSAAASYAEQNRIPSLRKESMPAEEAQTATVGAPQAERPGAADVVPAERVLTVTEQPGNFYYLYCNGVLDQSYDLSQYEAEHDGEVRLDLTAVWAELSPDVNGDTEQQLVVQTGLYGAGYTEGEATLRAYDLYGNLIALQQIGGNFAFSFPGAYQLGVEGGTGTGLTVLPIEPVYVTSSGVLPMASTGWRQRPDGIIFQYYVLQVPAARYAVTSGVFHGERCICAGTGDYGLEGEPYYAVLMEFASDLVNGALLEASALEVSGMTTIYDSEAYCVKVSDALERSDTLAEELGALRQKVIDVMAGDYFPADLPIGKTVFYGDGSYPRVELGSGTFYIPANLLLEPVTQLTAHELVHVVDTNIAVADLVTPAAWLEGRAEYISYTAREELGFYSSEPDRISDWSFLTAADKADYFHYYYFNTNRVNMYAIGYEFLVYLNETYGEDVSGRIMGNLAALESYEDRQRSEANSLLFKQCVEAATEVGVFQNFVRDVIEK